jgi:hypothetical protein
MFGKKKKVLWNGDNLIELTDGAVIVSVTRPPKPVVIHGPTMSVHVINQDASKLSEAQVWFLAIKLFADIKHNSDYLALKVGELASGALRDHLEDIFPHDKDTFEWSGLTFGKIWVKSTDRDGNTITYIASEG